MESIVIATIKTWNIKQAYRLKDHLSSLKYNVHIVTDKQELSLDFLEKHSPTWIFFPHWSWIIKKEIFDRYKCVVFHMTDLPYGRGGSPLQNLISRGIQSTVISAIRVNEGIDCGNVYLKEKIDISTGSAEEIFMRMSKLIFTKMIPEILTSDLKPRPQDGESVYFDRRLPEQSDLLKLSPKSIDELYDFIRMLDGEGYPKAFLKSGDFMIELSEVQRRSDKLTGRFEIHE